MNLKLHHVLSDISGLSGMAIIRAIVAGERDPLKLAALKHERVRKSEAEVAKALEGEYRTEHLFTLRQALELHDFYLARIAECDAEIQRTLSAWEKKIDPVLVPLPGKAASKTPHAQSQHELRNQLYAVTGVDLTTLPGMQVLSVPSVSQRDRHRHGPLENREALLQLAAALSRQQNQRRQTFPRQAAPRAQPGRANPAGVRPGGHPEQERAGSIRPQVARPNGCSTRHQSTRA
jgi:hypothetical protein